MERISATVVCRDEEGNIRECLESLKWVDEIVVVDSGSTDRTVEIAREYTDKVYFNPWPGMPEQKNHALDRATSPWVLNLDADERIPPDLAVRIREELAEPRHDGYRFPRANYFLGRRMRHGGWSPDHVLRLYRRAAGRHHGVNPHDHVVVEGGNVGTIPIEIVHYTYRTYHQYALRQLNYARIAAGELEKRRRNGPVPGGLRFFSGFLFKFLETYLWKGGILDGWPGFVASVGGAWSKMGRLVFYREMLEGAEGRRAGEGGIREGDLPRLRRS